MIKIRLAKPSEAPEIAKMWKEFMKEHDVIVLGENKKELPYMKMKKNATKIFEKYALKRIKSKDSVIHVAENCGKIVGYSLIFINPNIPIYKIEKLGRVSDLYVKKAYRKKGICSLFLKKAKEWFKKKKIKHLSIMLFPENKQAHSIYEKWGFFNHHLEMRMKI